MEQATLAAPQSTRLREFLVDGIELIESFPLLRPRWLCFDVALIVLFFFR